MSQQKSFGGDPFHQKRNKVANFEESIQLAGYGKFQLLVVICVGVCLFASLTEISMASYLLPAAECDLDLSLKEKSLLGSSVYVGLAAGSVMWGVVGDVRGRRKTMMITLLLCAFSTLISSVAPSFLPLLFFRMCSGFFASAASGLMYVYVGEFHKADIRPRSVVVSAAIGAACVISVPAVAWYILPKPWIINIPGLPAITSWRIFLGACSIPSFTAAFFLFLLPESPKFLISRGKEKEALEVFKSIYNVNTGKPKSSFSVDSIVDDSETSHNNKEKSILAMCWEQIAPLFRRELIASTCLVCVLPFGLFFGFSAIIMWMPEMFNRLRALPEGTATLCDGMAAYSNTPAIEIFDVAAGMVPFDTALMYNTTTNTTGEYTCDASIDDNVFIYGLFLSTAGGVGNILAGILIGIVGKRNLFVIACIAAAAAIASVPHITHPTLLVVVYCSALCFAGAGPGILVAGTIDLFPTSLKGMATCLPMMVGRIGALITTIAFAALLEVKCEYSFYMLTSVLSACALIGLRIPAR